MKKQITLLTIAALTSVASIQSAGVAVMALYKKFPTTMTVGKTVKVNAHFASIDSSTLAADAMLDDEGYVSDNDAVVELIEKSKGRWEIKALNPGEVTITLLKDKAGHRHHKHKCTHVLTVKPAKPTLDEIPEEIEEQIEQYEIPEIIETQEDDAF